MLQIATWRRLKLLSALLTLSVTSACAPGLTGAGVKSVSEYCRIAKPITYDSEADTPETVQQIEAHNSKWVSVCEGDHPKPKE